VYDPSVAAKSPEKRHALTASLSKNSVEAGKLLFAEHACLACHAVDGDTELLGPNLKDVGKRLSREELLDEIVNPSKRIKPSMNGQRVVTKDGKVYLGRVVNANENQLSVMLVGNNVIEIPRKEIESAGDEKKSLMYEGLLTGLSDEERESLLDYIVSLSN
jgi:putative heme-binding domain-containing protein